MKTFRLLFVASLISLLAAGADKVAYLNMDKAFNGYYRTLQENYKFEQQMLAFRDKLQVMQEEFQSALKEAENARAAAEDELASAADREESKRRFQVFAERVQAKEREIMRSRQTELTKLQEVQETTVKKLAAELAQKAKEFAKERGLTHVYEVSGFSLSQMPFLLVYPEDQEITEEFSKVINQGHEKELKDAQDKLAALPSRTNGKIQAPK